MIRQPPSYKRTDPLFPYPGVFRSGRVDREVAPRGIVAPVVGEGDRRAAPVGRDVAAQRRDLVPVAARDGSDGAVGDAGRHDLDVGRSEEHTSELQSLMRISYAVFCLKKKNIEDISDDYIQEQIRIHR